MSDTPRTDAAELEAYNDGFPEHAVWSHHARQLERELNASKQAPTDNDTWNSLLESRARLEMELHGAKDCLDSILEVIPEDAPCQVIATGETVADYILGLQREVEKVHKLYFETQARVAKWESELSSVMPPDFKDWWQNSKAEWPEVAKRVIRSLREREREAPTLPTPPVVPADQHEKLVNDFGTACEIIALVKRAVSDLPPHIEDCIDSFVEERDPKFPEVVPVEDVKPLVEAIHRTGHGAAGCLCDSTCKVCAALSTLAAKHSNLIG